jgi:hypothetical protein
LPNGLGDLHVLEACARLGVLPFGNAEDHRRFAEVPVDEASLLQRFDERRIELEGVLKMLERLHALEKLALEHAPELQMDRGFDRVLRRPTEASLEFFDKALPITIALKETYLLLQIHHSLGP